MVEAGRGSSTAARLPQLSRVCPGLSLGMFFHSVELPFVFSQWDTCSIAERGLNCSYVTPAAAQRAIGAAMGRHWAALARRGDPGAGWPTYDAAADRRLVFGGAPGATEEGWRRRQCDAADHLPFKL